MCSHGREWLSYRPSSLAGNRKYPSLSLPHTSSLKPQSDSGLSPAAVTGNITAASATAAMFYLENPYNKNDAEERRPTHQRLSKQYQRLEGEEASESVKFKIISSIKDNPPQLHLSRLKLHLHEWMSVKGCPDKRVYVWRLSSCNSLCLVLTYIIPELSNRCSGSPVWQISVRFNCAGMDEEFI